MVRSGLFIVIFLFPFALIGQSRFVKLELKPKEVFRFGSSDIIVADTLIMMDSSRIILNSDRRENYIRAKVAIIGNNCWVSGAGACGMDGNTGESGKTPVGPCKNGTPAKHGLRGDDGSPGINLFIYIDKIIVEGSLVIDLSGGNGGDGGDGGEGGGGSPGTLHCHGGDGGRGGDGGTGGNGGRGGALTFGGLDLETIRTIIGSHIIVNTLGGNHGYGGLYGAGGAAGLGPSDMDGRAGACGKDGGKGKPGTNGIVQFEQQ